MAGETIENLPSSILALRLSKILDHQPDAEVLTAILLVLGVVVSHAKSETEREQNIESAWKTFSEVIIPPMSIWQDAKKN
jgi:hypothetical protein